MKKMEKGQQNMITNQGMGIPEPELTLVVEAEEVKSPSEVEKGISHTPTLVTLIIPSMVLKMVEGIHLVVAEPNRTINQKFGAADPKVIQINACKCVSCVTYSPTIKGDERQINVFTFFIKLIAI